MPTRNPPHHHHQLRPRSNPMMKLLSTPPPPHSPYSHPRGWTSRRQQAPIACRLTAKHWLPAAQPPAPNVRPCFRQTYAAKTAMSPATIPAISSTIHSSTKHPPNPEKLHTRPNQPEQLNRNPGKNGKKSATSPATSQPANRLPFAQLQSAQVGAHWRPGTGLWPDFAARSAFRRGFNRPLPPTGNISSNTSGKKTANIPATTLAAQPLSFSGKGVGG